MNVHAKKKTAATVSIEKMTNAMKFVARIKDVPSNAVPGPGLDLNAHHTRGAIAPVRISLIVL